MNLLMIMENKVTLPAPTGPVIPISSPWERRIVVKLELDNIYVCQGKYATCIS